MQNAEKVKRLLSSAISFHKAADIINQHREFHFWPPIYVSLYYALEMSMKAFLSSRGVNRSDLKNLGHNLRDLVSECEKRSMLFPNNRFLEFVGQIDGKLLELRYLEGGDIEMVEAHEALDLTWQHIVSVCAHIPSDEILGWP